MTKEKTSEFEGMSIETSKTEKKKKDWNIKLNIEYSILNIKQLWDRYRKRSMCLMGELDAEKR